MLQVTKRRTSKLAEVQTCKRMNNIYNIGWHQFSFWPWFFNLRHWQWHMNCNLACLPFLSAVGVANDVFSFLFQLSRPLWRNELNQEVKKDCFASVSVGFLTNSYIFPNSIASSKKARQIGYKYSFSFSCYEHIQIGFLCI